MGEDQGKDGDRESRLAHVNFCEVLWLFYFTPHYSFVLIRNSILNHLTLSKTDIPGSHTGYSHCGFMRFQHAVSPQRGVSPFPELALGDHINAYMTRLCKLKKNLRFYFECKIWREFRSPVLQRNIWITHLLSSWSSLSLVFHSFLSLPYFDTLVFFFLLCFYLRSWLLTLPPVSYLWVCKSYLCLVLFLPVNSLRKHLLQFLNSKLCRWPGARASGLARSCEAVHYFAFLMRL